MQDQDLQENQFKKRSAVSRIDMSSLMPANYKSPSSSGLARGNSIVMSKQYSPRLPDGSARNLVALSPQPSRTLMSPQKAVARKAEAQIGQRAIALQSEAKMAEHLAAMDRELIRVQQPRDVLMKLKE